MEQPLPLLELDRNNAGEGYIGLTEFDERGYGVRTCVLSMGHMTHDRIMRRRFEDMAALMSGRVVATVTEAFSDTEQLRP